MKHTVLIVEDSPSQAELLRADLEDANYEVYVANSGEQALQALAERLFSLVISDVVMPGMSGYDLCRAVKANPRLASIPVMLLTSLPDPLDVVHGLEAGADNFLRKPYDPDHLVARVQSILFNQELRKAGSIQMGVELSFLGQRFMITSERQQILDLLISSFEDLVLVNDQLRRREAELADAREALEAALLEANQATRLKSEFLATMSHEIRNPINGVIGMTTLLLDTELDAEQREYAETVRASGEALLTVINDILDLSKIEAGKLVFEAIEFEVRTTVEEVGDIMAARAHAKDLELVTLVESGVPSFVCGDPGRLRQVLLNLVSNAVKFTETGEILIRVKLQEDQGQAGVLLRFDVVDTGIGLRPDQQAKIFDSFTQADASTTRRYGGTGLGLSICKQLVELMGGQIGVESEFGRGSRFWFTVRLALGTSSPPAAVVGDAALAGTHVLVVDDNATSRRSLEERLAAFGVRTRAADSGPEALTLLHDAAHRGDHFTIAVVDFAMPGMDGLELARSIAGDPVLSSTKIVLLTTSGHRGDARAAQQAGVSAYLTKPVHHDALLTCLDTLAGVSEDTASVPLITRHTLAENDASDRPHLLVVEDNLVNQKVAVKLLERLGYRVDVADNGADAVETVERIPYAAVLMDVQMPKMDGLEATRRIREREAGRRIPIIAMTANAMKEDEQRCLAAGMDGFISKPVKVENLVAELARCLDTDNQSSSPS